MWTEFSRKFEPTTGAPKTILCKKIARYKLDEVTRNPEELITELELLREDLQKMDIYIDNSEMMTHILFNLPEEYHTIVEIQE